MEAGRKLKLSNPPWDAEFGGKEPTGAVSVLGRSNTANNVPPQAQHSIESTILCSCLFCPCIIGKRVRSFEYLFSSMLLRTRLSFFFFPPKNITGGRPWVHIRITGGNHFIKPVYFLFQAYDMSSILFLFYSHS